MRDALVMIALALALVVMFLGDWTARVERPARFPRPGPVGFTPIRPDQQVLLVPAGSRAYRLGPGVLVVRYPLYDPTRDWDVVGVR